MPNFGLLEAINTEWKFKEGGRLVKCGSFTHSDPFCWRFTLLSSKRRLWVSSEDFLVVEDSVIRLQRLGVSSGDFFVVEDSVIRLQFDIHTLFKSLIMMFYSWVICEPKLFYWLD